MTHAHSGRFEGDSWDPASSVGATATMVAASRAIASQGPDPLLEDPLADPLVRAVGCWLCSHYHGELNLERRPDRTARRAPSKWLCEPGFSTTTSPPPPSRASVRR